MNGTESSTSRGPYRVALIYGRDLNIPATSFKQEGDLFVFNEGHRVVDTIQKNIVISISTYADGQETTIINTGNQPVAEKRTETRVEIAGDCTLRCQKCSEIVAFDPKARAASGPPCPSCGNRSAYWRGQGEVVVLDKEYIGALCLFCGGETYRCGKCRGTFCTTTYPNRCRNACRSRHNNRDDSEYGYTCPKCGVVNAIRFDDAVAPS